MTEAKELNWYFTEFIKILITLSLPAKEQFEAYGDGSIGKEMAEDLKAYYTDFKDEFLENGQILEIHKIKIDKLEDFLNSKNEEFFNNPEELYTNADWKEIRKMAKECLKLLKLEHLGIQTTIVNEPSVDENGEEVMFQIIQTQIIDKSENHEA